MVKADLIAYKCGPSGGILKSPFAYDTSKEHGVNEVVQICQMSVWAGNRIDQLQIEWRNNKGGTMWSQPIGGKNNPEKPKEPR